MLGLTSRFFFPCDCRRKEPDAPRLCQDPGAVVARVGGGCGEVVFAAVPVQEVSVERSPLNLEAIAVRKRTASSTKGGFVVCCAQGKLTVGFDAGALLAASATGSGRLAALVTSLRLEPVELATRLIFPFVWPWPFFSLELVVFGSGSSCATAAREALEGGMEKRW